MSESWAGRRVTITWYEENRRASEGLKVGTAPRNE